MGKQTFTDRDMAVLSLIRQGGQTMTYEEIGEALGLSPYQASRTVHKLIRHGLLAKEPGTVRAISVTKKGMELNPEHTVGGFRIVEHETRYWTLEDFATE